LVVAIAGESDWYGGWEPMVTWVLILNSDYVQKPPAVIGGYTTKFDAERAGDAATWYENKEGTLGYHSTAMPFYTRYNIIPAGNVTPTESIQCELCRQEDGQIIRKKWHHRLPE
jgi:hypothetical protein